MCVNKKSTAGIYEAGHAIAEYGLGLMVESAQQKGTSLN
jgi:L-lactate utilization protein LutC